VNWQTIEILLSRVKKVFGRALFHLKKWVNEIRHWKHANNENVTINVFCACGGTNVFVCINSWVRDQCRGKIYAPLKCE
jgi:hypothetical protein